MSDTYSPAVTEILPEPRRIDVMLKQKEVTTKSGLKIQSWWVKDEGNKPFVVQVLGSDAELEAGNSYMCILRERSQTRLADGRQFTELQIAGANPV